MSEAQPNLFTWGGFTSNAGLWLPWKFDLDALTWADWECLARIVSNHFTFSDVEGVPMGGARFAAALAPYAFRESPDWITPLLIVDDVLTTGGSMERQRMGRDAIGVVVIDRSGGKCPDWITPILTLDRSWM